MQETERVTLTPIKSDVLAPELVKLSEELVSNEMITCLIKEVIKNPDKKPIKAPIGTIKDKKVEKINGYFPFKLYDWNYALSTGQAVRFSITQHEGFKKSYIIVDIDTNDAHTLNVVEKVLEMYNGQIIAYASKSGAHLWFSIPEELIDLPWWQGRHTGWVSYSAIQPVDYINQGQINVGIKSEKTGLIEPLWKPERFPDGFINKEFADLFKNFNSKELNLENIANLPALPEILWPLADVNKDENKEKFRYTAGKGSNNEFFKKWAGFLNFKSESIDVKAVAEDVLYFLNDEINEYWYEDMDGIIALLDNSNNTYQRPPYVELTQKEKREKTKEEREAKKAERKAELKKDTYNYAKTEINMDELVELSANDNRGYVNWLLKSFEWRLLKDTLVMKLNDGRYISNSENIVTKIYEFRGIGNYDLEKAAKIYKILTGSVKNNIEIDYKHDLLINYNSKPLWIDRYGNQIDPTNTFNENNQMLIRKPNQGLENGIIVNRLELDFFNLQYDQNIANLYREFIFNAVGRKVENYNYVLRMLGYLSLQGNKFLRKMVWLFSEESGTGKSALQKFFRNLFSKTSTTSTRLKSLKAEMGLAPLANKALAVLDDTDSDFLAAESLLKTLASEMEELVNAKYKTQFEALMPKIIMSMNELPMLRADAGIKERIALVHWNGKRDTETYNDDTMSLLLSDKGRDTLFYMIISQFNGEVSLKTDDVFWKSPYEDMIDNYIEDNTDDEASVNAAVIAGLPGVKIMFNGQTISEVRAYFKTHMNYEFRYIADMQSENLKTLLKLYGYSYRQTTVNQKNGKYFIAGE